MKMIKYIGIIVLTISIITTMYLENQVSDAENIMEDFIESEYAISEGYLNYIKDLNKRTKNGDSTALTLIQIHGEIKDSEPYSKFHKKMIESKFKLTHSEIEDIPNICLFNRVCKDYFHQTETNNDQYNYNLIIEELIHFHKDSCELKITPIINIGDHYEVEFIHNDMIIDNKELNNFSGNLNELKAKIKNPITGEYYTVLGR